MPGLRNENGWGFRPSHGFEPIRPGGQSCPDGTFGDTDSYFAEPDVWGLAAEPGFLTSSPQPTRNRLAKSKQATNFFIAKLLRNCESHISKQPTHHEIGFTRRWTLAALGSRSICLPRNSKRICGRNRSMRPRTANCLAALTVRATRHRTSESTVRYGLNVPTFYPTMPNRQGGPKQRHGDCIQFFRSCQPSK